MPSEEQAAAAVGRPCPTPLRPGETITRTFSVGGKAVYWSAGIKPVDADGNVLSNVGPKPLGEPQRLDEHTTRQVMQFPEGTRLMGFGSFKVEALLYQAIGLDLSGKSDAMLATLDLPAAMIAPFGVMILISLVTRRNDRAALDRFYVRMKTPVNPDPELDRREIEQSYADPTRFDGRKLLPGTSLEFQRPTLADALGFVTCFAICFLIIYLAVWVAMIGS